MNLNIDSKDVVQVDENNIPQDKPGFVYDASSEDVSVENFPDSKDIFDDIIKIYEVMNKPELKAMKDENESLYKAELEKSFPVFSERYYSLFQLIITGQDISPLYGMLEQMDKIKAGKISVEDGEKKVGQMLASKYIYKK